MYNASERWPRSHRYELTSQIRRAAYSAAANIAEGWAWRGTRELSRYLSSALGSLAELACALRLARDLEIVDEAGWQVLTNLRGAAEATTRRLHDAVRKKRQEKK